MSLPATTDNNDTETDGNSLTDCHKYFIGRVGVAIQALTPEYLQMSEADLALELNPTPVDYALRRRFDEVMRQARVTKPVSISVMRLVEGICTRTYFEEHFIHKPERVAWIIRPPVPHEAYYEAINKVAIDRLLNYVSTHQVSERTLTQFIKIAEMSANRAYGAVVQKIQTKNLNLEGRIAEPIAPPGSGDAAQLEQRAKELQAKFSETVIDVTDSTKKD